MSVQRLGPKWLRKLTVAIGEPVKIGWANGGYVHSFATETHRHGEYNIKTGEVTWAPQNDPWLHLSSCYTEEWPEETRAVRELALPPRRTPRERLADAWDALAPELDLLLADPRVDRAARQRILTYVVQVGMAVSELHP